MNIREYWKVHRNNFDSFLIYISRKYNFANDISVFKDYYVGDDYNDEYLYLFIQCYNFNFSTSWLTYCRYVDLVNIGDYKYNGEYLGRKEKIEELNRISRICI